MCLKLTLFFEGLERLSVRLASFWAGPFLSPAESAVEGRGLECVKNSAEFGGKVLLRIVFDKCRCFRKATAEELPLYSLLPCTRGPLESLLWSAGQWTRRWQNG